MARDAPPYQGSRFVALDGLRGLAALAVVVLHAHHIAGRHGGHYANVALAVDFFFGLSGFVVAHAYDARLRGGLGVGAFMRMRLHRLYPMIALGVALSAAVWVWNRGQPLGGALALAGQELLLLPVGLWRSSAPYPLDPPIWSLLFELLGCLAYALLVKTTPARWLPWITAAAGAALAVAILAHGNVTGFGTSGGPGFLAGGVRIAYSFLFGVVAYRLQWRLRAPVLPIPLVAAALLAVLFWPFATGLHGAFQALAVVALLPLTVLAGAQAAPRMEAFWDLLGRLSYPLYLVHWPVLVVVNRLMGGQVVPGVAVAAGIAASAGVAWVALRTYDEPVRRALARWRRIPPETARA